MNDLDVLEVALIIAQQKSRIAALEAALRSVAITSLSYSRECPMSDDEFDHLERLDDELNNAHENLVICPSQAYHTLLHVRQKAMEECGNKMNQRTTSFMNVQMLDVTAPRHVQVEWDAGRRVLYVHVDGVTVLRCCQVKHIEYAASPIPEERPMTNKTEPEQQIGRLAMRQEGDNWIAYYAMPNRMQDAIFLGSIRMAAVVDNPIRKQAFMDMMRDIVSDVIEETAGVRPTWGGPETAPEHERSGSA